MYKTRITIFIGAYGSGKTEVAVNYALRLRETGQAVGLVDLDIVNPYFRSRELAEVLAEEGIDLVSTPHGLEQADLPALSPRIFSLLQKADLSVVFDVGGDPVGARALGRFHPYFAREPFNLWLVLNPYRPGCSAPEDVFNLAVKLEAASKLKITGIVDNANLGKETTGTIRAEGSRRVDAASRLLSVPVVIRTTLPQIETGRTGEEEIMNLQLFMLPPWEKPL